MPHLETEIRLQRELTGHNLLLPPRFPRSLPIESDPEGFIDSENRYAQVIEDAKLLEDDGVALFNGGPMSYPAKRGYSTAIERAWLTPMIVQDDEGFTAVHMITINGQYLSGGEVAGDVRFITASDADLMLDNVNSPGVREMERFLSPRDKRPRTLIRVSTNGNTYYPYITSPNEIPRPEVLANRLAKLSRVTGIPIPIEDKKILEIAAHHKKPVGTYDGFTRLEQDEIDTPYGKFIIQGMYNPADPWEYYEILSAVPIDQLDRTKPVYMRIDSGCDTGQCYHEKGCECRNQLHKAMKFALKEQGLLLLCASHNGRGFGLVSKLVTEGAKQGIDMGYNKGEKLLTIPAAELLLGRQFDIRTYGGASALIRALNIDDIRLLTDNRLKLNAIRAAGIHVARERTRTQDDVTGETLDNVHNKLGYDRIYLNDDED